MKECNEIPKVIHYCWFGRNPLPAAAEKCIMSWREKCPEYTIVKWTEDNFDLSECPIYVQQAYRAKKWAFVTDYARLKIVYDNGGIYLDTDVELLKSLSPLLINSAFFGFEDEAYVATGLGFGAVKGAPILMDLMKDYEGINFVKDNGEYDLMSCPVRNLHVFQRYGLVQNNKLQTLKGGIVILPTDFLCRWILKQVCYIKLETQFLFIITVPPGVMRLPWKEEKNGEGKIVGSIIDDSLYVW